jgi:hypothetical protein
MKDFQVWAFGVNGGHETTQGEFDNLLQATACAVRCSMTCSSATQNVYDACVGKIVFSMNRVDPQEGQGSPVNYICSNAEAIYYFKRYEANQLSTRCDQIDNRRSDIHDSLRLVDLTDQQAEDLWTELSNLDEEHAEIKRGVFIRVI